MFIFFSRKKYIHLKVFRYFKVISKLKIFEMRTWKCLKLSWNTITYFPTKFSKTLLLPALWPPITAICGKSKDKFTPNFVNASCNLLTMGIRCSIPIFPVIFCQVKQFPLKIQNQTFAARGPLTHHCCWKEA